MTKKTFKFITLLLILTGCNFFNSYQLPDHYIGIECQQQQECIEVEDYKILKNPILKIEYASGTLNGKKQMLVTFSEESKNEIQKLFKDNMGRNIAFFYKELKLQEINIDSEEISYITYDLSQSKIDIKKLCTEIVNN